MNYFDEFFSIIQAHLLFYVLLLIIVSISYIILLKKLVDSLIDPIVLMIVACIFSTTNVIFMIIFNMIEIKFFYQFIATEGALIIGMMISGRNKSNKIQIIVDKFNGKFFNLISDEFIRISYFITAILFNVCAAILFVKVGVQIGNPYRINGLYNSGIYYTIISNILPIYLLIMLYRSERKKNKVGFYIDIINFSIVLLFILLIEASKSNLLILVNVLFFYIIYLKNSNRDAKADVLKKGGYIILSLAVVLAIFMSVVSSISGSIKGGIDYFLYRLVAFGDVYPMYYMSNAQIVDTSPLDGIKLIVGPLISVIQLPFKVMGIQLEIDKPLGFGIQLYQYLFKSEYIAGPNSRHNVFSIVYFGNFFGVFFSLFIGYILGLIKKYMSKITRENIIGTIIYMIILSGFISSVADPAFGISRMIIQLAYILSLYIFVTVIVKIVNNKAKNEKLMR
ncbi:hypothetical protein [Clostridium intestinale]|uniref:Oligosaccharide repeat unit polymerase n=1 Tax=Clostridium intestinale TaxID=36845 RepID=A0A7D6VT22_9CLOT|nr:hypothetical protein [Clostridium intestinale]QLY79130.1 hypothetical protein HZF06_18900 [Clostridium intestinale]